MLAPYQHERNDQPAFRNMGRLQERLAGDAEGEEFMPKILALLAAFPHLASRPPCAVTPSSSRHGTVPLTKAQLDEVTGGIGVGVAVSGSAGGSNPSVDARVRLMATPNVAAGHVFVMSRGDDPTSSALVTPFGDNTHFESNTVTTPSGISISQSNGVAH